MEKEQCFVCLKYFSTLKKENDETCQSKTLDKELQVIFILRKLLRIPNVMCYEFLEEFGNPSDWVHCCESCSVSVKDARDTFDSIELLKKEYEKLRSKFFNVLLASVQDKTNNELEPNLGVSALVRSYVWKGLEDEIDSSNLDHSKEDNSSDCTEPSVNDNSDSEVEIDLRSESDPDEDKLVDDPDDSDCKETNVTAKEDVLSDDDVIILDSIKAPKIKSSKIQKPSKEMLKPFSCSVCQKKFARFDDLKRHSLVHLDKKTKQEILNKTSIDGKEVPETEKKKFTCLTCSKSFRTRYHLTRHERVHTGEKPYVCYKCDLRFADSSALRRHVTLSHDEEEILNVKQNKIHPAESIELDVETIELGNANNQDSDSPEKKKTILETTGTKMSLVTKKFTCDICDKSFGSQSHLTRHKRVHTGEKPCVCYKCDSRFADSSALGRHLTLSHNGEASPNSKQNKTSKNIELSEKSFDLENTTNQNSDSRAKRKSITEMARRKMSLMTKKFTCDRCDKSFATRNHLNRHKGVHTGSKPHKCEQCTMRFSDPSSLRRHVHSVHNGVQIPKNLECKFCQKRFSSSSHLSRHINGHTGEKPYSCETCGVGFSDPTSLKYHKKKKGHK